MAQQAIDTRGGGHLLLQVTAVTHRGSVRTCNEDTIVVNRWICNDSFDVPLQSVHDVAGATLVLVADGLGGHVGGRVASRRAAKAIVRLIRADTGPAGVAAVLRRVNGELYAVAADDPTLAGMGTTVAGIAVTPDRTIWFNVGDSRVYSVRQEYLRQLSVDDVPAGAGSRDGRITQSLGGLDRYLEVEPHVGSHSTRNGRRYLLCSDGLTDAVPLETVERLLTNHDQSFVTELLERTLAAGAPDNVSIVLASIRRGGGVRE